MTTKITDANIDSDKQDNNAFNISLLGFKMAVNEGLTVFNLVDGVVDEFNDESGTDEAEGSNDTYCATSDFYQNITTAPFCVSAGFTTTSVTEPDTSTAGTNPAPNIGTYGAFTVPTGMSSLNFYMWGASGGNDSTNDGNTDQSGGSGGFSTGTLAVSEGQIFDVVVAETGTGAGSPGCGPGRPLGNGGGNCGPWTAPAPGSAASSGGGLSGLFTACSYTQIAYNSQTMPTPAPSVYAVAAGGGGSGFMQCAVPGFGGAGSGGGLTGRRGYDQAQNTDRHPNTLSGGAGSQSVGGEGGLWPGGPTEFTDGGFLFGGRTSPDNNAAGGGAGYYGGGGASYIPGVPTPTDTRQGGGGSSYYGHPQITCGSTDAGSPAGSGGDGEAGGESSPFFPTRSPSTAGNGLNPPAAPGDGDGNDGYVLLTGTGCISTPGVSSTIVSTAFTSSSVATNARIVVFEENVDTPTLNTDIIASISRDAGVTFTNATLSDSGYVTGSSGQRILTGQADISGQPSGQSMRWKLALANNTVKIHGVSLQWS